MATTMKTTRTTLVSAPNLPAEFVRINWSSERARNRWEPIFGLASSMFGILEQEAVRQRYRSATLQIVSPQELESFTSKWIRDDFMVVPVGKVQDEGIYQSSGGPCDVSKPWKHKVVIGKFEDVRELVYAFKDGDNFKLGEALGYPPCCIKFFEETWVKSQWLDTSLPMAEGKIDHISWNPFCNILLRWLGLRFVSHLPCSFSCAQTVGIGETYRKLAYDLGYRTTADALYDILSWPVEWSGLHGMGLVVTPVCRVEFRTDSLDKKQVVRLHSDVKPDDSAKGLVFPLDTKRPMIGLTKATANGFSSKASEKRAHNLLLDLIRYISPIPKSVIDLGCGDMTLLLKINQDFASVVYGVDSDPDKEPSIVSDIFNATYFDKNYDLALISRARIKEQPDKWAYLLEHLERHCRFLIIYSYDGDTSNVKIGNFHHRFGISENPNSADLYELPI